jgi:hypothetical protein
LAQKHCHRFVLSKLSRRSTNQGYNQECRLT